MRRAAGILLATCLPLAALAQDDTGADLGFAEVMGAWGFQIGNTPYIPKGDGTSFDHPLANGPAVGAAVGLQLVSNVFATVDYEFTTAKTREGEITGVVDEIVGMISYHTLTAGLRLTRPIGPGELMTEFGAGVLFPFSTKLEYTYNPALSQLPVPITGSGSQVEDFALGLGGRGAVGYHLGLGGSPIYTGLQVQVRTFISTQNGKATTFENFVTDFAATPIPTATTGRIEHEADGGAQPSTYSVNDGRLQLVLGARF